MPKLNMIEDDILKLINEGDGQGDHLASLADQFRAGRDIGELITMLDSKNQEIVGIAAWIAGEIRFDPSKAQPLISRLTELTNHGVPSIRFHAISALFPHLDMTKPSTQEILSNMSRDPNEGVRLIAKAALERMSF